jgi:hypothetical protein
LCMFCFSPMWERKKKKNLLSISFDKASFFKFLYILIYKFHCAFFLASILVVFSFNYRFVNYLTCTCCVQDQNLTCAKNARRMLDEECICFSF